MDRPMVPHGSFDPFLSISSFCCRDLFGSDGLLVATSSCVQTLGTPADVTPAISTIHRSHESMLAHGPSSSGHLGTDGMVVPSQRPV
jgi:hypothetical protein